MTISARAHVAGVMGWPIGHSLSPRLHGFWLREYGIDGAYIPMLVNPDDAASVIRALPKMGFAGTNVTIPHKEVALATVDEADERARAIGSVNTIVCRPDGSLWGTSTDGFGFMESLKVHQPDWNAFDGPAVVLGAGGSSRAVCAALIEAGSREVRLVNRTTHRAEAVADALGSVVCALPWSDRDRALLDAAILVNTTSQGMIGNPPLEISLDHLPPEAIVTDIVYTPLMTPLLKAAAARGNPVVDGLEMLLHQARPGFAHWFGKEPVVTEELRRYVRQALGS